MSNSEQVVIKPKKASPVKAIILLFVIFTLFGVAVVLLTPKPEEVTLAAADVCQEENNGKIVTFDGYLELNSFMTYCGDTCPFDINETKVANKNVARVNIKIGSGKNTMDSLPNNYTKATTVIRDSKGERINIDQKITVTGKLNVTQDDGSASCRMDLSNLNIAEDQTVLAPKVDEIATFDNFDTEAFYDKMIAIEGFVTIPKDSTSVFCYGTCTLDFSATPDFGATKEINVSYGDEANQMSVPSILFDFDPNLRDFNGQDISSSEKLRLIGNLSKTEKDGEPTTYKFNTMWVEKI